MASLNPRKLQSQMVDALSCTICFNSNDLVSRVPKAFPCLHTICLACADELCQQTYGSTFPCPVCRQPVPIPTSGTSSLPTNLDVQNMAEIVQKTAVCSTTHPDCLTHPTRPISYVCINCEVGLCSRCITSAMKEHSGHEVLEIEDAFEKIKERIDTVIENGKKACQLLNTKLQAIQEGIQEKKATIESCSTDLASAYGSKNFGMFGLLRKLSTLVDTTSNNNLEVSVENVLDSNDTNETLMHAVDTLHHELLTMKTSNVANAEHAIASQKLATVTVLIDLIRMNLYHHGLQDTLVNLWSLCYECEACCQRVVMLGGADLLISCFETSVTNEDICLHVLSVYGLLVVFPALHPPLLSSKSIKMLVYSIQNFTQYKGPACKTLSFFLSNPGIKWPGQCASRDEISALVISTCKQLPLNKQIRRTTMSFRSHISLLSQNVSEAAKYWPVWSLHLFTDQHSDFYCPMLADAGVVTVLKQQNHAHEYVQRMAKSILKKFEECNS